MHRADHSSTFPRSRRLVQVWAPWALSLLLPILGACSARPAPGKEVLSVWDFKYGEAAMGDAMRLIDRSFELAHPGVRVDHRALSDVDDDATLAAAITAKAAPDVVMVHSGAEFRSFQDYFAPLDSDLAPYSSIISSRALDVCRGMDGRLRAVPLTEQGFGWYYNKALFREAGMDAEHPPRRWEDFLAACAALVAAGVRPIAWGDNPPHGVDWLRRSLAATFFSDEELRSLFSDPEVTRDPRFLRIATMIRELRDEGYLDSSGAFGDHIGDAASAFASGGAGLFLGLWSDIDNWKEFSDALGSENVGFFGSLDDPSAAYLGRACAQGAGVLFAVTLDSSQPRLAASYALSYLSESASKLLIQQVGAIVPRVGNAYPTDRYPVLRSVLAAAEYSADDVELHYPNLAVKAAFFRYDELFYNTREISLETYLSSLSKAFSRVSQ